MQSAQTRNAREIEKCATSPGKAGVKDTDAVAEGRLRETRMPRETGIETGATGMATGNGQETGTIVTAKGTVSVTGIGSPETVTARESASATEVTGIATGKETETGIVIAGMTRTVTVSPAKTRIPGAMPLRPRVPQWLMIVAHYRDQMRPVAGTMIIWASGEGQQMTMYVSFSYFARR